MPKVTLSLEAAKAKDADIFAKLGRVQNAAQNHKQQTKLNQQRLDWSDQASKLASEARRLESDMWEVAGDLGLGGAIEEQERLDESTADVWFQVAGLRRLLAQVRQRDPGRLRSAPEQALALQEVLASVLVAAKSRGASLEAEASELDQACGSLRRSVRQELSEDGAWSNERGTGDRCELSDEEDALLEALGGDSQAYHSELEKLSDQVSREVAELESELAELRRKCKGWDDNAHFRFVCIKQHFQARRDLLMDRLSLEFPHLSREQLQAHEAVCDALKFATQRQAAAFRQWRRERLSLLRRHRAQHDEQLAAEGAALARRREQLEQRGRQRQLHGRLEAERARACVRQEERRRVDSEHRRQQLAGEAERAQRQRRRAQSVKDLSREHAERRREQQLQLEQERAEGGRREAEDREARMDRNAEIVRLRRQMDELKQQELTKQRQDAEQEQREREHRLQEALEKLRVEAPRDPSRLLKVPARTQAPAYHDPLVCVTRGPHAGFDEKKLMGDARYKISAALQAAGLFGTQAGHDALASVPAPRPAQPHIVSQVFAGGYPS
mmetsp:Transcript_115425/g.337553  ORF Transcript_115425/g.337553 Transcript_115425/m.337553 type:complete len:558 (-) Transcript_115425:235-1908(-)